MTFDYFIDIISDNQREIILYLDALFLSYPEVSKKMRYKLPFYYYNSWVCYLNTVKGDRVELCFINGQKLSNNQGLLDTRGRKMIAGIMLDHQKTIPNEAVLEIFGEAIILDELNAK